MSLALHDRQAPLKVLIVKLSSLGDVVHAMPAVMDIQAAFPNAQIDWVVERGFAPLAAHRAAKGAKPRSTTQSIWALGNAA